MPFDSAVLRTELSSFALETRSTPVSSQCSVVLRVRAKPRKPLIGSAQNYLGRYQLGQERTNPQDPNGRLLVDRYSSPSGVGLRVQVYFQGVASTPDSFSLSVSEWVPGGDSAGPVLAAATVIRPDGDQVLAHLGSGVLAQANGPYLDEGISL